MQSTTPALRHPWFPLSLSYAGMMAIAIAVNLLPVFLTTLSAELGGLTAEQQGRLGAVSYLGLVLAILTTGRLADHYGPRVFVTLGNLLIAAGLGLLAVAPGYTLIMLACFIMGFGAGTLDMILSPLVSALQPHRRTVALNLLHSFYCTGAVATIFLAALALRWGFSWRTASLALLPMPFLLAVGFLPARFPPLIPEGQDRHRMRVLIREPYFLLTLVAIFLGGATEVGMAYWLPTYAEQNLHFPKFTADLAFLGFSLAMAAGRLAIGLLPHMKPIPLMLGCCVGSVVLFLAASFAPWPPVALAACILAGLTGSCLWPSTLAVAADRFPHGGASMFALLAALGNFGGIFMPWCIGLVADHAGLAVGLAVAAACPALMIVALLALRRHPHLAPSVG
ncbi:MAG: MFS transporter [Phycisphaerae bacterium]